MKEQRVISQGSNWSVLFFRRYWKNMDVAQNPAQTEVLLSGLSWGLRNVASSVLTSEQAVFLPSKRASCKVTIPGLLR